MTDKPTTDDQAIDQLYEMGWIEDAQITDEARGWFLDVIFGQVDLLDEQRGIFEVLRQANMKGMLFDDPLSAYMAHYPYLDGMLRQVMD